MLDSEDYASDGYSAAIGHWPPTIYDAESKVCEDPTVPRNDFFEYPGTGRPDIIFNLGMYW